MHGTIRTLVNPPTTLKEFDAEQAKKAAQPIPVPHYTIIEAQGISHTPGALSFTAYDAVTLERTVIAVHCKGQVITEPGEPTQDARFVLWFDPVEFRLALSGAHAALQYVEAKRDAASQAALEQDCDRREELIRLGHDN